jgi:hypothetical protein
MNRFDSIFFGGTGWNLPWSFGVAKKLEELGFKNSIKRVGSLSGGCFAALAFLGAADYEIGVIQCEQLKKEKHFLSFEFRKKFWYYFEGFVYQDGFDRLKNSSLEYHCSYTSLNEFPKLKQKFQTQYEDRHHLLETCMASVYVPLIFGVEPSVIGMRIRNGDYAIDGGFIGDSTYRWDEKTLLISSSRDMSHNTIGNNFGLINTVGFRAKSLTNKELFLKGYSDASRWYAEYILYENFEKKQNWCEYIEDYDSFKKKI